MSSVKLKGLILLLTTYLVICFIFLLLSISFIGFRTLSFDLNSLGIYEIIILASGLTTIVLIISIIFFKRAVRRNK